MASGTTAEGTTWTTRPMSDDVAAKYRCVHHAGTAPCVADAEDCTPSRVRWFGEGGKPYSPGTPKGSISSGLPASVGDYLAVFETARRRLNGLESWPVEIHTAPRLSKIAGAGDPKIRRAYREFIDAIRKSGGVPSYQHQLVAPARKRPQKTERPAVDVRAGQIWEDCDKRHQRRRIEVLSVVNGYAVVKSTRQTNKVLLSRFRATSTGYRLVSHDTHSRRKARAA